jgi:aerobic-type carbon monoxide dehydrogenase small subunit (CoxS/CutS family)
MDKDRPDRAPDPTPDHPPDPWSVSRRRFIQTLGVSSAAAALSGAALPTHAEETTQTGGAPILGPDPIDVTLRVNGKPMSAKVEPATTLLEMLRLDLNLTGTKEICDRGSCGGCSVLLNGTLVCSCMTLAADAQGAEVTTVEGLATDGKLDPVQESFIRHDGFQCGYCTPGFLIASRALLNEKPKPTLDEIKCGLSGNYCRCAAYCNMYNAVLDASGQNPIRDDGSR